MSVHSSLRISGGTGGLRNVWTRAERLAALKKVGKWEDGDSVLGLPKVRTRFKTRVKKAAKAEAAPAAGAAAPAAAASAPAAKAGAAPAKGAAGAKAPAGKGGKE
jgi:small basic protein (TIGR04137 family)